ncbi:peroxidase 43-like [Corylus avellana]|uniref:peroxidase 43-like n=1 Tax=Corylus avellana TaxID=13451 RepID=UPI00286D33A0|nr:peroxidase 43-like [Corylus avellana]
MHEQNNLFLPIFWGIFASRVVIFFLLVQYFHCRRRQANHNRVEEVEMQRAVNGAVDPDLLSKVIYHRGGSDIPFQQDTCTLCLCNYETGTSLLCLALAAMPTTTAESIVRTVVQDAIHVGPRNASILLRLQFHDCFVEGCDGSILIRNGLKAEINAPGHAGVGGFEVIAKAKQELETVCKGVVSCADIVVLAARDALFFKNVPFYEVPTGRRDGRVSNMSHAADMPEPDDSVELQKSKFMQKGLSREDLVLLSAGAHTIGTVVCGVMQNKLYNFSMDGTFDPDINPHFLPKLKALCPRGDFNDRIPLHPVTNSTFDDQSLRNTQDGFSVLASDAIESYPARGPSFVPDFTTAMVKTSRIGVKTGNEGEIRRVCSHFN